MHYFRIPRSKFDRLNETSLIDRNRNHEIAINIFAIGGEQIRFGHGDHQIRLSKLPAFHPLRRWWQVRCVSFNCPFGGPLLNQPDLIDSQSPFLQKVTELGLRQPGRHVAAGHDL